MKLRYLFLEGWLHPWFEKIKVAAAVSTDIENVLYNNAGCTLS